MNVINVTNIAALTAYSGNDLVDRATFFVLGFYTEGDGGGGTFYFNANSTTDVINGLILKRDSVNLGRFIRVLRSPNDISVLEVGAKPNVGDSGTITNNTNYIQALLDYLQTENQMEGGGGIIRIPRGVFYVTSLVIGDKFSDGPPPKYYKGRISIIGEGVNSILKLPAFTNQYILDIRGGYCMLNNFQLDGNGYVGGGTTPNQNAGGCIMTSNNGGATSSDFLGIIKCRISSGFEYGAKIMSSGQFVCDETYFLGNGTGVYLSSTKCVLSNQTTIQNSLHNGIEIVGLLNQYMNVTIDGCYLENNRIVLSPTGYHIKLHSLQASNQINIVNNYFNGSNSQPYIYGVGITNPTMVNNLICKYNQFRNCLGAFSLFAVADNEVGLNDIGMNLYTENTPPSIPSKYGFLTENSVHGIIKSPELVFNSDLKAYNVLSISGTRASKIISLAIIYTADTSGTTTSSRLKIGNSISDTKYYNDFLLLPHIANEFVSLPVSAPNQTSLNYYLLVSTNGTDHTQAGKAIIQIEYIIF